MAADGIREISLPGKIVVANHEEQHVRDLCRLA
jgi:hypothetical protein